MGGGERRGSPAAVLVVDSVAAVAAHLHPAAEKKSKKVCGNQNRHEIACDTAAGETRRDVSSRAPCSNRERERERCYCIITVHRMYYGTTAVGRWGGTGGRGASTLLAQKSVTCWMDTLLAACRHGRYVEQATFPE